MTPHQQQAEALFDEWREKQEWAISGVNHFPDKSDLIAFAAFCLERRDNRTGLRDADGDTIYYGNTIESIDSEGKSIRHTIERDPETGLPIARYGPHSTCSVYQKWIDEFKKVIVLP